MDTMIGVRLAFLLGVDRTGPSEEVLREAIFRVIAIQQIRVEHVWLAAMEGKFSVVLYIDSASPDDSLVQGAAVGANLAGLVPALRCVECRLLMN
jgi:predicted amino acid-binding ACT domain protein